MLYWLRIRNFLTAFYKGMWTSAGDVIGCSQLSFTGSLSAPRNSSLYTEESIQSTPVKLTASNSCFTAATAVLCLCFVPNLTTVFLPCAASISCLLVCSCELFLKACSLSEHRHVKRLFQVIAAVCAIWKCVILSMWYPPKLFQWLLLHCNWSLIESLWLANEARIQKEEEMKRGRGSLLEERKRGGKNARFVPASGSALAHREMDNLEVLWEYLNSFIWSSTCNDFNLEMQWLRSFCAGHGLFCWRLI